jgi:Phage integrase central domain
VRAARGTFTRTWQFRRKTKGHPSITTLGTYPDLSIQEDRLKAAEMATKRQQSTPTVEEAAEQWMAERVDHTHRKADQVRGYVDRAIIPELGNMRVRDVEPADIARVIRTYRDRIAKLPRGRTGGRPAARALLAAFKGLFGYCVANGWISISPAAQLTAAVTGPPPQARERVLTDDEIRFVMTTDIKPAPVLRFLLATGLRLGEAYSGHREGQLDCPRQVRQEPSGASGLAVRGRACPTRFASLGSPPGGCAEVAYRQRGWLDGSRPAAHL